jgi:hypothetical protein
MLEWVTAHALHSMGLIETGAVKNRGENAIHTAQFSGVGENRAPGDRIESNVTKCIAILT